MAGDVDVRGAHLPARRQVGQAQGMPAWCAISANTRASKRCKARRSQ
jgi:hypothetical protein